MSERDSKLSAYLLDISKIVLASAVIGYFIPDTSGAVNFSTFFAGAVLSFLLLIAGLAIIPK